MNTQHSWKQLFGGLTALVIVVGATVLMDPTVTSKMRQALVHSDSQIASLRKNLLAQVTTTDPNAKIAGTIDPTFNTGTGSNLDITAAALQADGKIVIGGGFGAYNGVARWRLARLNADGSLDMTFDVGTLLIDSMMSGIVHNIVIQPDGKILVFGSFKYNGGATTGIARFNANGTLDATFTPGTGTGTTITFGSFKYGRVFKAALQPDGKIVIVGAFESINGVPRRNIARLNANGTLDTTFTPGTGFGGGVAFYSAMATTVALQADGKVIVGGQFASYNGVPQQRITRLNANGSLDTTFNAGGAGLRVADPATQGEPVVNGLFVQPDGKILVRGTFDFYNNAAAKNIARLNTNGTLDTTFNAGGSGLINKSLQWFGVDSMFVRQADGKLLLAGQFSSYNGVARNALLRLNPDGSLDTTFDPGVGSNDGLFMLLLQKDNKILLTGSFFLYNNVAAGRIVRLYNSAPPACTIGGFSTPDTVPFGSSINIPVTWSTTGCNNVVVEVNTGKSDRRYVLGSQGVQTLTTSTTNYDNTVDVTLYASGVGTIATQTRQIKVSGVPSLAANQCAFTSLSANPVTVSSGATTTISWQAPVGCNVFVQAWTPSEGGDLSVENIFKVGTYYYNATDTLTRVVKKPTTFFLAAQAGGTSATDDTSVHTIRTVTVPLK